MSKIGDAIQTLSSMEDLAAKASPVHRIHANVKILITFFYLVAVLSFHRYNLTGLMPYFLYPAMIIPLANIPFREIFKRVLVALPFSLFAGISNLIFDREVFTYLAQIPLTFGFVSFWTLMVKTFLCVCAVLILVATTNTFTLFAQLRSFKIPKVFVLTLMMTYRYIFVLLQEAGNMMKAYALRAPGEKGIQMKDMGSFVGQLLLRCIDRSEHVYAAMQCRGFTGEYIVGKKQNLDAYSVIWGIGAAGIFLFFRFFSIPQLMETLIQMI
ncbi:MAG TPA: cobalt ECF transporter T component CbiQ [Clostridiales bacterium]|nr:cobalt ECF transporter T component CbiQ [Clostridiales bacterium]